MLSFFCTAFSLSSKLASSRYLSLVKAPTSSFLNSYYYLPIQVALDKTVLGLKL
jgi:hypothetical protein